MKDDFEINEDFDSKTISNDRDKDIMISKEGIEVLVTCKFRPKSDVRFNDVERTAAISSLYGVRGLIVTNIGFGKKAVKVAKELGVMLSNKFDIKHKLNFYIEKANSEKELDILETIEEEEKVFLYVYE